MDIRFINSKNEVINATNLSIKVINKSLIGINERNEVIEVEKYDSEEIARKILEDIAKSIYVSTRSEHEAIIINLGKERDANGEFK